MRIYLPLLSDMDSVYGQETKQITREWQRMFNPCPVNVIFNRITSRRIMTKEFGKCSSESGNVLALSERKLMARHRHNNRRRKRLMELPGGYTPFSKISWHTYVEQTRRNMLTQGIQATIKTASIAQKEKWNRLINLNFQKTSAWLDRLHFAAKKFNVTSYTMNAFRFFLFHAKLPSLFCDSCDFLVVARRQ